MRLIDADALMEYCSNQISKTISNNDIARFPTATIKERKGKWKWNFADNGWKDIFCSECGWTKNVDVHVSLGYSFCPNCGADMRGGSDETN